MSDAAITKLTVEQAIDRIGLGKFQHRIMWASGLCNCADAMEVLLLSFLQVVVQHEFGVGSHEGSLLTSVVFLGAMCGTLALGWLGDRWGRKPTFIISCVVMSVCGALTAAVTNYWAMVVLRFGVGIGLGGIVIPYDTLAEFLPSTYRGNYLVRMGVFWTLGTMTVPLLAYLGLQQEDSWRLFVLLCSIPCIISTFLAFAWVPESPRFLISQGKADQALKILRHAAEINGKDPVEAFPEGIHFLRGEEEELHGISCLFKQEWIRLTLSLWAVWIGKSFMYWGSVQIITLVFTGTTGEEGGTYTFDYGAIFVSSTAELVGVCICLLLVDRTGRRATQSVLYMLGGAFVFGLCWLKANNADRGALMALAFFARMCTMGGAQLTWIITAEIMPTKIRTTGHAMASAVARVGGASMPWLASTNNSFKTMAIAMLCIGIYAGSMVCLLPETAGRSLGTARLASGSYDPEGNPLTEREEDTEHNSLKLNEIS